MEKLLKIKTVKQFNDERGQKTLHPLVSVLDQSQSQLIQERRYLSELYIIFLKEKFGELRYGRRHYDYQEGTLLFIAPGQVFGFEKTGKLLQPTGWALCFHPDFLRGTSLGRYINDYNFFSYNVTEALHLSDREKEIVVECFRKIRYELEQSIDKHSRSLIVSNIELFLKYCVRFYDRQFITRDYLHKDTLVRFEQLLGEYFKSDKPQEFGLPTVKYFAEQLHLSAKYFGDLVKKETGKQHRSIYKIK